MNKLPNEVWIYHDGFSTQLADGPPTEDDVLPTAKYIRQDVAQRGMAAYKAWCDYKANPRPETRNNFLRAYAEVADGQ